MKIITNTFSMKKIILVFMAAMSWPGWSAETGKLASSTPPANDGKKMFSIGARAGVLTRSPDIAVLKKWEHNTLQSYKYAVGGQVSVPPAWKQFKFLGGGEYQYLTSKEELSGSYNATIDVTISQLILFGGVEWAPYWARGFGADLTTGFMIAGEKKSKLDAEGFTQDLGTESPRRIVDITLTFSAFYDFGRFRPYLTFETDSAITAGGAYVF